MGAQLPKQVRCFFAYAKTLHPGSYSSLTDEARSDLTDLVQEAIKGTLAHRPKARISTIVKLLTEQIQEEVDEIMVRDQDGQHIARIIDAAMATFLATCNLANADEATVDKVAYVVRGHMEDVARDWSLTACTSMRKVLDDLIKEATERAEPQIEVLLRGAAVNEDEKEDCDA